MASRDQVRGEIVLVIDTASDEELEANAEDARESAEEAAQAMAASGMRQKDIMKALRSDFGLSRNEAYDLSLAVTK